MNRELSAYHVHNTGVLCYGGLPTLASDIEFKHHNGTDYSPIIKNNYSYEVGAITQWGLVHGVPYRKFDNQKSNS